MPLDRSWLPLSENPDHSQKTNRSTRRCIWRYCFQAGVWNCRILNQVVESQLFTSLWNRYHQWLSGVEFIQISAFSASYSGIKPRSTAGKRIGVWNCHATCERRKTTTFTSIVYGCTVYGKHSVYTYIFPPLYASIVLKIRLKDDLGTF